MTNHVYSYDKLNLLSSLLLYVSQVLLLFVFWSYLIDVYLIKSTNQTILIYGFSSKRPRPEIFVQIMDRISVDHF